MRPEAGSRVPGAGTKAAWETGHGELAQTGWQPGVRNSTGSCHSI
jgi:hypothetical protein